MTANRKKPKLGVLASHRGSNFQAILDAISDGSLNADVVVAISNNSRSEALIRAKKAVIQSHHFSGQTHPDPKALDQAIADALQAAGVDLVVTAGYMKKLGPITLERFSGKIVNIHPSLLPKYGGKGMFGMNVHQAVIDNGDSQSGLTVHLVDADYDTGPVLSQKIVPVEENDTPEVLALRIIAEEHKLLVNTLIELVASLERQQT